LKDDELLLVNGKVESTEGQEITLILEEVKKITDAVPLKAKNLSITLPSREFDEPYLEDLFSILNKSKGNCEITFNFTIEKNISLKLRSQPLRIQGTSGLENQLKQKGCEIKWVL
jgi:hypothetical protein